MAKLEPDPAGRANFTVLVVMLGGLSGGLTVLVLLAADAAAAAEAGVRETLLHLAWIGVLLLALALLLLAWVVFRHLRRRLSEGASRKPTAYVDAWQEAGRRIKLDRQDADEDGSGDEGTSR